MSIKISDSYTHKYADGALNFIESQANDTLDTFENNLQLIIEKSRSKSGSNPGKPSLIVNRGYMANVNLRYEAGILIEKHAVEQYSFNSPLGGKYLLFLSSRSVKWEIPQLSQFVYFLRKVCLFFNFWTHHYVKQNITVSFIIQKLKHKHIFLKKYKTEKAEESLNLTEWEERKTRYFPP